MGNNNLNKIQDLVYLVEVKQLNKVLFLDNQYKIISKYSKINHYSAKLLKISNKIKILAWDKIYNKIHFLDLYAISMHQAKSSKNSFYVDQMN